MLFAVLALAACLLMTRLARDRGGAPPDRPAPHRLGVLIGLAALTRNEATWLAASPGSLVAWRGRRDGRRRLALVAVPAVVALVVFAPWMIRDWIVFGSPLPGQALANALSVTGFDIFAWNDPPTLSRYLAVGPARLLEMRVEGLCHNLFTVLLIPGFPLVARSGSSRCRGRRGSARSGRSSSCRVMTFLVTSLLFPVATTWGTFLHAAGPVQVLLIVCPRCSGSTRLIAWSGVGAAGRDRSPGSGRRSTIFGSLLFSAVLLPAFGGQARRDRRPLRRAGDRMAAIGRPLDAIAGPGHHRLPDLARRGAPAPDAGPARRAAESTSSTSPPRFAGPAARDRWRRSTATGPASSTPDAPGAECFRELDLGAAGRPGRGRGRSSETRVFEIVCP